MEQEDFERTNSNLTEKPALAFLPEDFNCVAFFLEPGETYSVRVELHNHRLFIPVENIQLALGPFAQDVIEYLQKTQSKK